MPRRDDVRDAMRDDAGLAAARARQNQKRSFGAGYGFALLRVQPFEEIHERGTLYFSMRRRKNPLLTRANRRAQRRTRTGRSQQQEKHYDQ